MKKLNVHGTLFGIEINIIDAIESEIDADVNYVTLQIFHREEYIVISLFCSASTLSRNKPFASFYYYKNDDEVKPENFGKMIGKFITSNFVFAEKDGD